MDSLSGFAVFVQVAETRRFVATSMACNSVETLRCFAQKGLGVTCLPDFAIGDALKDGVLRPVLKHYVQGNGTFRVLWPASKRG